MMIRSLTCSTFSSLLAPPPLSGQQDRYPRFCFKFFGGTEIHSLWPKMSESPILTQFGFSPLILAGYLHNQHHGLIPGLMVIYLRRSVFRQARKNRESPGRN
ncbi:hypothetical protein L218DRAFT_295466 [Marasmius fiardii PR-910]|nr:hypothetical protein L218DRAFT_295466 [Marasmius fiardii PR-910]